MKPAHMISFRCANAIFERLEQFALERNIDRTSALRLALHFFLNRQEQPAGLKAQAPEI